MFPRPQTPTLTLSTDFRARLIRGLDVAVEFATLGEYGVAEIELDTPQPADDFRWDWPPRCSGRSRVKTSSRARPRAAGPAACASA